MKKKNLKKFGKDKNDLQKTIMSKSTMSETAKCVHIIF